ncbi:MAG: folate family ECF transporter S component [Mycoplasmataceae bacterium]|nr:folate family ECF transporter S component [Mycoplasmataceae bacterium]
MDNSQLANSKVKKFFFPLAPIKVITSLKTMLIIALMIALKIVFELISIPIPGFVVNISFGVVIVLMMGWYFGPVYGLVLGFISDTLCYFIHPTGVWFWMYALQEPLIGMIAGIVGSAYRLRKQTTRNIVIDIVIQQIMFTCFVIFCFVGLVLWTPKNQSDDQYWNSQYQAYRWVCCGLLCLFYLVMEVFTFWYMGVNWKNKENSILLFTYVTFLALFVIVLFSLALGPWITAKYLAYINGYTPSNWVNIGFMYYFIPRVIIDCIKTPIIILLSLGIVFVVDPIIDNAKNGIFNRWD